MRLEYPLIIFVNGIGLRQQIPPIDLTVDGGYFRALAAPLPRTSPRRLPRPFAPA